MSVISEKLSSYVDGIAFWCARYPEIVIPTTIIMVLYIGIIAYLATKTLFHEEKKSRVVKLIEPACGRDGQGSEHARAEHEQG